MSVMDKMKEKDDAKKKEQKPAQAVAPLKAEPEKSSQPPAVPGRVAIPPAAPAQAAESEADTGGRVAIPRRAADESGKHPEQYLDSVVVSPGDDQKAAGAGGETIPPKPPPMQPPKKWKKYVKGLTWGTVLAAVLSLGGKITWDLFLEGIFNKYDIGGKVGNVINKVPNHFTRQDIWDAMKVEQNDKAEFKKKVNAEVAKINAMEKLVEMESKNGYPTFRPLHFVTELEEAEDELGKTYETVKKEKGDLASIELQLENEKAKLEKKKLKLDEIKDEAEKEEKKKEIHQIKKKIAELELEKTVFGIGKSIEEDGYSFEKMKFSTKPVTEMMDALAKAEGSLGKTYARLQDEGRTAEIVKVLIQNENDVRNKEALGKELLVLQLGENLENRLRLERLIFEAKKTRNISVESLCGNTMVGVEVKEGDLSGYPTQKVCNVETWNVVDVKGKLMEVTVYDDHIVCPDDCKGKGSKKAPPPDRMVPNISG